MNNFKKYFTRRKTIVYFSVIFLLFVLFSVEHSSTNPIKKIFTKIGIIDSKYQIVSLTDIKSTDHVRGDLKNDIVLIEYSSFGCSVCAFMQEIFDRLVNEGKVSVVSRYLYEKNYEGRFFDRAVYAECVSELGGNDEYFKFIDYLYKNQFSINGDEEILTEVVRLGIFANDFEGCIAREDLRERIIENSEEGWKLGSRGTPYIVVVYKGKPVGISYANKYSEFVERIRFLIGDDSVL